MFWHKTWRALRQRGVLGINQRNCDLILQYNQRHLYPLVDNKLLTKQRAITAGMRVPTLYGVINTERDIAGLGGLLSGHRDFVIKPAQGAGGDGIIVVADRFGDYWRTASGKLLTLDDLEFHISGILSGIYSLGGHRDSALVEYRVQPDSVFSSISFEGVPDIRIIVLRGYPVMAMLRLPTRQSQGKANLHQGAIGVGVDLASGVTLGGTWHNLRIERHPDTANPVSGVQLPFWNEFLQLASQSYELTGLGYLGVDMVLDRDAGPMILELNARPGLNIQIANDSGLMARCREAESEMDRCQRNGHTATAEERIRFCQQHFSSLGAC
ncbi:MAG: alpha-L-glutamate ligase-like protein [Alcanivoracaceae bacterium]|jgi:alpha-L-glutamate ligase-like protein|nr:alpha-L-glutamate ligase-like protein [Alcanivoracaceae bacterium]